MGGEEDTDAVSDRPETTPDTVHATTVALGPRAIVIRGPSGSGKSSLALRMMALGAQLVADDRTCISRQPDGPPIASAAPTIRGMIEARGLGILAADPAPPTPVMAVVDLGVIETERLPEPRTTQLAGAELPLFHKVESDCFPAALMLYLKGGLCLR